MTPKETRKEMIQILAEASSSLAIVNKKAAKFKQSGKSTEDDPHLGRNFPGSFAW